jgi:hypothetical protein
MMTPAALLALTGAVLWPGLRVQADDPLRLQVRMTYRHVRVQGPSELLGRPAAPEAEDAELRALKQAPEALIHSGNWVERLERLVAEGRAEVLHEAEVSVMDGYWGTVYLGDVEARAPEFVFQARPVVVDGGILLSVAYGALRRVGGEGRPAALPTDEVCVNCGPGLGAMVLVPAFVVTTRLEPGQSALAGGAQWAVEELAGLAAPANEWVVVTAEIEEASQ